MRTRSPNAAGFSSKASERNVTMKINTEDVGFHLEIKTDAGWISLPALRRYGDREDDEDVLYVVFSQVVGIEEKGFRLVAIADLPDEFATVTAALDSPVVSLDEELSGDFDSEATYFISVRLTTAELDKLTAEMSRLAESETHDGTEIKAEYRPVDDGGTVRHCVIIQHDVEVDDHLVEYEGVNADQTIVRCGGIVDSEETFLGTVTVKGTMRDKAAADHLLRRIRMDNEVLQSKLAEIKLAEAEPVPAAPD